MTLPNQLTVLRIILTPIAVFFLLMQDVLAKQLATGVFIIASLTDWYDGHFARKYGYVTKWGKFLDPLADKTLISAMLFSFVILKYIKFGWVIIIVLRDVIITALRGYMMVYGKPVSTNLLAKWKTFSQVGLVYALLIYINIEQFIGSNAVLDAGSHMAKFKLFIDKYVLFVVLFTVATGIIYIFENRRPLKELFWRLYRFVMPLPPVMNSEPDNKMLPKQNPTHSEADMNTANITHKSDSSNRTGSNIKPR